MSNNKNDIKIYKVDYFVIAPFRIRDKKAFQRGMLEASSKKLWQQNNRNKGSLKEHLLAFLGQQTAEMDTVITPGHAFQTNFQNSEDRFLSTWKSDIRFVKQNDEELTIGNPTAQPEQTMELYIAPNYACGIAVLPLSGKQETLSDVVKMNYVLHKTDLKQAPKMKRKSSFDRSTGTHIWTDIQVSPTMGESRCGTLLDIFEHAMPAKEYVWDNPNRLVMATYVSIAADENTDMELVKKNIISIGQVKNDSYQFAWNSLGEVSELYSNILAYATPEGFVCCVLNDQGDKAGEFIRNFGTDAFRKSYLPIFFSSILADLIVTNAIRNLDEVAGNTKEQNLVREAQLAVSLTPSHYEHLIRLMRICKDGRQFDEKASTIRDHIEARKMQLESYLNLILGFIGVGQVVFAILEFTGVNFVFGDNFANSLWGKGIVLFFEIVFLVAIIYFILYVRKGGRKR